MEPLPDWTLLRSFLAVAEAGSLSAASRQLGASQPTLGRHIKALEAALGVELFDRVARGLALTGAGADLLPLARSMRDAASRISLVAAGHSSAVSGTVRITASRIVSHHFLPSLIARLRQQEPGIEIELVPSDQSENLLFREADIAVRMYRPEQLDVITSHVADLPLGLYASRDYLARKGRPESAEDLLRLDLVGFDRSDLIIRTMRAFGVPARREDFPVRCDDQIVHWELVRAGCGVGGMQRLVGDADRTVERIAPFISLPSIPVWLTAAETLRQSVRVRRVFDFLAEAFRALPAA